MNENEKLIKDFIFQEGIFDPLDGTPFVEPQDMKALKFYKEAVEEILARAEAEESESERRRLMQVVKSHHYQIERILDKYEENSWFRT